MSVVVWNAEWARPSTTRGGATLAMLASASPDVLCLTEAHETLAPPHGHTITSAQDYGYEAPAWRRKVVLWSPRACHCVA